MSLTIHFFSHTTRYLFTVFSSELGGLTTYRNALGVQDRQSIFGGDIRDRTVDLLRARQSLSQLSYVPKTSGKRPMLGFLPLRLTLKHPAVP